MNYLLFSALLILIILFVCNQKIYENWQDYTLYPYGYIKSGSDPLYFKRKDRYRRPYRDGFKFYQSYPVPHLTMYE